MNYRLSPSAQADIRSIWSYTNEAWGSRQADRYILRIEATCDSLAHGKVLGRPADHFREGYRMMAVGSHFVFFKTSPDGRIDVFRVLHQRMDILTRLNS